MNQCPVCKQMLEPGVRFCPNDGAPVTETALVSGVRTPAARAEITQELQLPVVVGGRYRLVERRGGGGMAKVYRSIDLTLEREVAVKLINPELRADSEFDARFQREARIASQLADPHIVVVHDFGLDDAHGPFLVMEYLQGQSLREHLAASGPMPVKAAVQLSAQLLLALIHAHGKNIVHRDIKPDNIFLLNQSGVRLHVRVLDFGIARILRRDPSASSPTLTTPGAVMGTPRYMSPEQLAGQPVDARSDLYSAALVIFEALTGQLPYVTGKKLNELCPEVGSAFQELLEECLKPNPQERIGSAIDAYLRLQEVGKASGILLLPAGTIDRLVAARQRSDSTKSYVPTKLRPPSRRWLVASVLALVLAVGLAIFLWQFLSGPAGPQEGAESLLDVRIGDNQQDVVDRLQLTKGGIMNPWADDSPPESLGRVLQADDLGLSDAALNRLNVQWTGDERVCVLFADGKVRAVVVRRPHPAETKRGVKILASGDDVDRLYGDDYEGTLSGKEHVEVRRYAKFGIGFEIRKVQKTSRVTAITLYPPAR